jgi:hypothetical protein
MKTKLLFFFLLTIANISSVIAQPTLLWQKSLGGSEDDFVSAIKQTNDSGYIVLGWVHSNDGDVSGYLGEGDYWVVKMNADCEIVWQKTYGGLGDERPYHIQQTNDNGYVISGSSNSNDSDVSGNHGDNDFWILKITEDGTIQWQKSLGGTGDDWGSHIVQTNDAGYIVAGYSFSNDGDVGGNQGERDYWIVKLDEDGLIQWEKSMGGSNVDWPFCIQQTSDEGYIVAGATSSVDGDVIGNNGGQDAWLVKLDNLGNTEWQKPLGGSGNDFATWIEQTADGGYILTGLSRSNDGDVSGNHGMYDVWIVKLTNAGTIEWQKTLGGSLDERANSIKRTIDGGYILAGWTGSNDGDVEGLHGNHDIWVVKIDNTGSIEWQMPLGGTQRDAAGDVLQTTDGGYIVTGSSESNDGNVSGNNGQTDIWITKLGSNVRVDNMSSIRGLTIFPNPTKNKITLTSLSSDIGKEYRICDVTGHLVEQGIITSENQNIILSFLSSGTYILKINGYAFQKIMLQKE